MKNKIMARQFSNNTKDSGTNPTTGPFQKVLVASKELEQEKDDFDFDQNESQE